MITAEWLTAALTEAEGATVTGATLSGFPDRLGDRLDDDISQLAQDFALLAATDWGRVMVILARCDDGETLSGW